MPRNLITSTKAIDKAATAAAAGGPKRLGDGDGLYLLLFADGGAHGWRFDFTFEGKRKTISFGTYPDTGLALARKKADEARAQLAAGVNPSAARKEKKAAVQAVAAVEKARRKGEALPGSFEFYAREFHKAKLASWSATYAEKWLGRMQRHVFPYIGSMLPDDITAPIIMSDVLQRLEDAGHLEIAHTSRQMIGQVYDWLVPRGKATRNPAADLRRALPAVVVQHMGAITTPKEAGLLMRGIQEYSSPITRAALKIAALTFQRPGNVRAMEWEELDLDRALWTIPSAKMKRTVQDKISGRPHLVPLSRQAVAVLRDLQPLTGGGVFVFPGLASDERCMSDATMGKALLLMGWEREQMTAHGFRAMARTLLVEELDVMPDIVEAQLAHVKSGPLGSAYDRAGFLKQRADMMQRWADYLDELRAKAGGKPLKQAKRPTAKRTHVTA